LPNHMRLAGTRLSGNETECYRLRFKKAQGEPP
jgi:hypothetical protein